MANILNSNKDGLKIFEDGIEINKSLAKWKNAREGVTKNGNRYIMPETITTPDGRTQRIVNLTGTDNTSTGSVTIINNAGWVDVGAEEPMETTFKLDEILSMELRELNKYINDNGLTYILKSTGRYNTTLSFNSVNNFEGNTKERKKKSFAEKVKLFFEKKSQPEMDVVSFFANVKSTSKESFNGYVNRVEKYLKAIHNARIVGQEALVEKLTREMIANRYESFLYAEGYYHVITEEQVVNFVKKSERGISLDYMKNFVRPIPECVIEKVSEAEKLEVFDNFVIMHYDPKGVARQDTAKEEAKKRDPIVFGVIAGSTKLYYITDWIDEYCDLTLEKFVDTIGVTKNDLVVDEEIKAKLPKEEPKKEVKKTTRKKAVKKEEIKEDAPKTKEKKTKKTVTSKEVDEAVKKDITKSRKKK